MYNKQLLTLGINLPIYIPIERLLDERYPLDSPDFTLETKDKVQALREILSGYNRTLDVQDTIVVHNPVTIARLMYPVLRGLDHEELWGIFLNKSSQIISRRMLSKGGIDSTSFDTRQILKTALLVGAVSLILIHNHPSLSVYPSKKDVLATKQLKSVAHCVDILLLDHLVLSGSRFYSFSEEREYDLRRLNSPLITM